MKTGRECWVSRLIHEASVFNGSVPVMLLLTSARNITETEERRRREIFRLSGIKGSIGEAGILKIATH
jgi:hypothetical protein